jgi:predicted DNA-binding transcriptional regulator AlpA
MSTKTSYAAALLINFINEHGQQRISRMPLKEIMERTQIKRSTMYDVLNMLHLDTERHSMIIFPPNWKAPEDL